MITDIGDKLLIVTAPHFVAGVCMSRDDIAVRAAPILKYMIGWEFSRIESYVAKKGWKYKAGTPAI